MPDAFEHTRFPPPTRVSEPEFLPECVGPYRRAMEALTDAGVPFLVGGALAMNAYTGIWRDTKDLDLFLRPRDARRALDALGAAGFQPQMVYEEWLGKAWEGDVFVDLIWRNANGLFPVTDEWLARAPERSILGLPVPVLPVEELILSKMMVGGRYRFDGADILHVLHAAHDRIDWRRLERGAGEHAGLLLGYLHMYRWGYPAWRDRVPLDAMRRLEMQAEATPSTHGAFRALLLDLQSFRVDVEGWSLPDPHAKVLDDIRAGGR